VFVCKNIDNDSFCDMFLCEQKGLYVAPNIKVAKKYMSSVDCLTSPGAQYSPAYSVTNEDLRRAYQFMPKNAENVLVVSASGDHPMFATLYGAGNIDTFDISYNAKCVMDIKTIALQVLKYDEYKNLLNDLFFANDVQKIKNMDKIFDKLPIEEQNYMRAMRGYFLFNHGLAHYNPDLMVTESEYNQMRKNIKKTFDFIWSDITSLHHHLNKQYDFIHLSNIFDFLDEDNRMYVLTNMMKYTKPNGVMCFQSVWTKSASLCGYCDMLEQENKEKWNVRNSTKELMLHVLQRVR